jgi:hypothetical protein
MLWSLNRHRGGILAIAAAATAVLILSLTLAAYAPGDAGPEDGPGDAGSDAGMTWVPVVTAVASGITAAGSFGALVVTTAFATRRERRDMAAAARQSEIEDIAIERARLKLEQERADSLATRLPLRASPQRGSRDDAPA